MRKMTKCILLALCLALALGGGAVRAEESRETAVFRLTNEARARYGLAPLTRRLDVEARALIRAEEIAKLFSHKRPDGKSCFSVLKGIAYRGVGENIAKGSPTPQAVLAGWMASPGHRANILRTTFTGLGVGVYKKYNTWHWVQLFVR